jgi:hypothetical protein
MALKKSNLTRIAIIRPAAMSSGVYVTVQDSNFLEGKLINAAITGKRKAFKEMLAQNFPADVAYREFCEDLKKGLEAKGFQVIDMTGRAYTTEILDERAGKLPMPEITIADADVILMPHVGIGYSASSAFASYKRKGFGQFLVVDVNSHKVLFRDWTVYQAPDSKFEYASYDSLKENFVSAIDALRGVAAFNAKQIVNAME